jgi:diaminopimelate epimerase
MARIEFLKMHGCGNDFIVFDDAQDRFSWHDLANLALQQCRRRFAIGADGLIAVGRPAEPGAQFEMRYLNADGSRAEMCGNGIRCVGKFIADELGWERDTAQILTGAGVLPIHLLRGVEGRVASVTVGMGVPKLRAADVPTTVRPADDQAVGVVLDVDSERFAITTVSMGNPHAVIFVDRITDEHVLEIGPQIEVHPLFPKKTNVEFVQVQARNRLRMRVWERGCGETLACGTGACASVVAAVLNGHVQYGETVMVQLLGGELGVRWASPSSNVEMTGPAETAYRGVLEI